MKSVRGTCNSATHTTTPKSTYEDYPMQQLTPTETKPTGFVKANIARSLLIMCKNVKFIDSSNLQNQPRRQKQLCPLINPTHSETHSNISTWRSPTHEGHNWVLNWWVVANEEMYLTRVDRHSPPFLILIHWIQSNPANSLPALLTNLSSAATAQKDKTRPFVMCTELPPSLNATCCC